VLLTLDGSLAGQESLVDAVTMVVLLATAVAAASEKTSTSTTQSNVAT
jgi:hypothetical protein